MNNNYGHWEVLREVDLNTIIGFVYVITFDNGKKYIGAKKVWKRIKTPPSTFKRGPKKGFEMSDWQTYTSSSKEVNDMIASGASVKQYLIVGWYDSWGKTLLAEAEMQLQNNVLVSDEWLNKQVGGHFNPGCYDELTQEDIERYSHYEVGNQHTSWPVMYRFGSKTKYVHPDKVDEYLADGWFMGRSPLEKLRHIQTVKTVKKFKIYNMDTKEIVDCIDQRKFALDNGLMPEHVSRLLSGELDRIGVWSLPIDIRRNDFVVQDPQGRKFSAYIDCDAANGFNRGGTQSRLRSKIDNGFVKLTPESRSSYKKRLKENPPFEFVKIEKAIDKDFLLKRSYDVFTEYYSKHPAILSGHITLEQFVKNMIEYYGADYTNNPFHPQYVIDKTKQFSGLTRDEMFDIMRKEGFEYNEDDDTKDIVKKFKKQLIAKLKNS